MSLKNAYDLLTTESEIKMLEELGDVAAYADFIEKKTTNTDLFSAKYRFHKAIIPAELDATLYFQGNLFDLSWYHFEISVSTTKANQRKHLFVIQFNTLELLLSYLYSDGITETFRLL